jgi:hypothetical protein
MSAPGPTLTSSKDPQDPGYRRLRYIRYADDELLGFTGPKAEAEEIKERLARFLRDELALELSAEKTLITHARTRAARFLGYDIITQTGGPVRKGRRATSGVVGLRVPKDVIRSKSAPYLKRSTRAPLRVDQRERPCDRCHLRSHLQGNRPILPARR